MYPIKFLLLPLILAFPHTPAAGENPVPAGILPFQQSAKGVALKIKLNDSDRPLTFLFDTGADGMAIRKALADSLRLPVSHAQEVNIVGGKKTISISTGNTVHLSDSLQLEGQHIAIFDRIADVDGIIGLNLLREYVVRFDFGNRQLQLYAPEGYTPPADPATTLPVTLHGNLIYIAGLLDLTGKGSGVEGRFLLDTGANYHLIAFSDFVRRNRLLLSGFKPEGTGSTVSMGHATPVYHGKAHRFSVGDAAVSMDEMPVTLQASTGNPATPGEDLPDGSVGIRFLSRHNFTICLHCREVYIEK
ncbi:MAG: aspartyl protease family protein [Proteiniphilum sp.]|jgi:predicted aspartyl protease|nr:aspartyl protease family protein [Proteiniphilum sp.]